jgi:DNA (cytosine-5)-methyltransferase 1
MALNPVPLAEEPPPFSRRSSERQAVLHRKTFAEFFAGIGLARVALERQGWRIAFANDISPQKYAMYKGNFADAGEHFVLGDVAQLDGSHIPAVSLAFASFPCQDLSLAGPMQGLHGGRSSMLLHFMRVLDRMPHKPPLVLLENVASLLESRQGEDLLIALQSLNSLGYAVDVFLLDAAHFVPQSRRRLFIVGLLEEVFPGARWGPLAIAPCAIRPGALAALMAQHAAAIRWLVRPLPTPPTTALFLEAILENPQESDPQWWSAERTGRLLGQMRPALRATAERMIRGERWSYGTVFRRTREGRATAELRTDGIAGCLRTAAGGSSKQILVQAGFGKFNARLLTPREAARLMGADDYHIAVPFTQALTGFGDAVCVPVIEWIARHYLQPVIDERLRDRSAAPAVLLESVSQAAERATPGREAPGRERVGPIRLDLERPLTRELIDEIVAMPPATAAIAALAHLISEQMRAPEPRTPYAGTRLDLHDVERLSINALHRAHPAAELLRWIGDGGIPTEVVDAAILTICPPEGPHLAHIHDDLQRGNPHPLPPEFRRGKAQSRFPFAEAKEALYRHWQRCLRLYEGMLRVAVPQGAVLSDAALALVGFMLRTYLQKGYFLSGRIDPPFAMLKLGWWMPVAAAVEYFEELAQHGLIQPSASAPQGVSHVYELSWSTRALLVAQLWPPDMCWIASGDAPGTRADREQELAAIRAHLSPA